MRGSPFLRSMQNHTVVNDLLSAIRSAGPTLRFPQRRLLTLIAGQGKQERGCEQHRNEQDHLEKLNRHSGHPVHQE